MFIYKLINLIPSDVFSSIPLACGVCRHPLRGRFCFLSPWVRVVGVSLCRRAPVAKKNACNYFNAECAFIHRVVVDDEASAVRISISIFDPLSLYFLSSLIGDIRPVCLTPLHYNINGAISNWICN